MYVTCNSIILSIDPTTRVTNANFYVTTYKTDLISCIDIYVFMWQKQLNYSFVTLLYCHVKSSEFVGLWSNKNIIKVHY